MLYVTWASQAWKLTSFSATYVLTMRIFNWVSLIFIFIFIFKCTVSSSNAISFTVLSLTERESHCSESLKVENVCVIKINMIKKKIAMIKTWFYHGKTAKYFYTQKISSSYPKNKQTNKWKLTTISFSSPSLL